MGGLGEVDAQRNQRDSALKEFAKEEQLFPDDLGVYRIVADLLSLVAPRRQRCRTVSQWIELDPKNYDAYAGLSAVLNRQKKYSEVLQLWLEAAQQLPERSKSRNLSRMPISPTSSLTRPFLSWNRSLVLTSGPMDFNNASYELTDANVELAKAKEWGEKAINSLYQESLHTTSDEGALANTNNILATWDTLGWVYYRMGDFAKAESYLRSAFDSSQSPVIGDHLAQVYEKQSRKQEAAHTYQAGVFGRNEQSRRQFLWQGNRRTLQAVNGPECFNRRKFFEAQARRHLANVSRRRAKQDSNHAPGGQGCTEGRRDFSVTFSPGKIEDVKFVSGDEKLKGSAPLIEHSSIRAEFPDSTPAYLTRHGLLLCSSASSCDFTLLLPGSSDPTQTTSSTN